VLGNYKTFAYSKGLDDDQTHFIWVAEFTTVDLYNAKKILCEVVLDATCYKSNDAILYSRILNKILVDDCVYESDQKTFTLFRHNLGERTI